jgi:hypothetical protein
MTFTYTPDGKLALFVGDVGQYGAFPSPTKVGGAPISAVIESQSTTRGNVMPRMTNAQILAIPVPTPGMYVFNTDNQAISVYTTSGWVSQTGPAGAQYMSGSLTAAQINDMYNNAISLIPTPGANEGILVREWSLELVSDGTAFTGGGAIGLQFGNVGHAGLAVSTTIAATLLTGAGVNRLSTGTGIITNAVTANYVNTFVAITNATAVFAAGGLSTVNWKIWFSKIPTA